MGSSAGLSPALPREAAALALCAEVPAPAREAAAPAHRALSREGSAAEPARAALPADEPDFSFAQPGLHVEAYGEAERREGSALQPLIASLQAELRWAEPPPALPPGPWFGAVAFGAGAGETAALGAGWEGFAPLRFSLPRLLRWSSAGRHYAAVFGAPGETDARALRKRLDQARRALDASTAAPAHYGPVRVTRGSRARWDALVAAALSAIARGELDKVVLARAVDAVASAPIAAAPLLAALAARYPTCTAFLLRGDDGAAFLGATPETFCRVEGRRVFADALAGSAPPGQAAQLLESGKDLREHAWVVSHLEAGLRGLCSALIVAPSPRVRALANVAHLCTPVEGTLRPGVGVAEVIEALHPTPAVLGVPSARARRFLAEHEGLERGLYAGLVGLIGPGGADLKVALRCALLRGSSARLFAGAGVVQGSTAQGEWDETGLKAAALLGALETAA